MRDADTDLFNIFSKTEAVYLYVNTEFKSNTPGIPFCHKPVLQTK
jgi:hypothetical protein